MFHQNRYYDFNNTYDQNAIKLNFINTFKKQCLITRNIILNTMIMV